MLTAEQIESFVADGFVRVPNAFSTVLAAECRNLLWKQLDMDPDDRSTWTREVVRLGLRGDDAFVRSANAPALVEAYDQLVGAGRWRPLDMVGTFPIRFPVDRDPEQAEDYGWHIDASFLSPEGTAAMSGSQDWEGELPLVPPDYDRIFRSNLVSRGRALLVLLLYSDTGERDAPTLVRVGSHLDVPSLLEPYGAEGTYLACGNVGANRPHAMATGRAGDAYLCHPFLVHTPITNTGTSPRFMAQPSLQPEGEFDLDRADGQYVPVERAIRAGLARG
ncbi:phytanoyl-CoA dioxygenase family protein [Micromonospora rubida]|uniref:phytanoyl-CoA dioxygenase family protein n=1 Tax=Micromonospora rubida TaxID=2697657 RepID=UPI0013782027|nr:phytanoyl-CoA dioxygenase family protein [Micromonospora rubida]NBE82959.1 phytanoyl-CoA dioxygenase [Micromonospora rubida]